jgi:Polyketide cyclase / dehydrase and lipid transport
MPEVTCSHVLEASADSIWNLLEDFGSIQRWWPTDVSAPIERVSIEGDGVGMIRHIYNRGARHAVSERLDFIEPSTRTLVLSIVGARPVGITAYVAEGHVIDLGDGRCRIDYRALVSTSPDLVDPVRRALLKTWATMFRGLEACARATCHPATGETPT